MNPSNDRYDPAVIEPRWQARWDEDRLNQRPSRPKRPYYALTMYPYPSGSLHIGHWYAMTPSDARARYMRMRGYDVFFPMGFDAFGLPAENAAIERGIHPREWTMANIDRMRRQLKSMGAMFDWSAEVTTCEPKYYKWDQWLFLKFLENGLAYRQRAAVDFCPRCNTTLAREQVIGEDRVCERCSTPVVKKDLEQWFLRTTAYADELLAGLETLDWPERVKTMQRNWIGRSVGAEIVFGTDDPLVKVPVFTTRADTLYGVTALVLAPEHPLVDVFATADRRAEVDAYRAQAGRQSEIDRLSAEREKTGVFSGSFATHPLTGGRVPIWIADYVLTTYGTGAVMMVPGHDERDFEFAQKYGMPIVEVIRPAQGGGGELRAAYTEPGIMVNSGPCDGVVSSGKYPLGAWSPELAEAYGLPTELVREGKQVVVAALEKLGMGCPAVTTRLRDWLISRQRYWGTPIPIVYCPDCGTVGVALDELPVELPEVVQFQPTGESPLKFATEWLHTTCPRCGGPATRDTDTMDTFVDSSWYQYRYLSPDYGHGPFDPAVGDWLPVHQYTGGVEHATMHLLYTRFWTRAMRDLGLVDFDEPMTRLFNQGIILGEDSEKMSKSRGNVVDPDNLVARYGADTVRAYLMFIGPWELGGPWDPRGIQGVVRWLHDVWALATAAPPADGDVVGGTAIGAEAGGAAGAAAAGDATADRAAAGERSTVTTDRRAVADSNAAAAVDEAVIRDLTRATHQTIRKVGEDLEAFAFNTAVAALMEFRNAAKRLRAQLAGTTAWDEAIDSMLLLMAPLTPHIAEELWACRGRAYSVHTQPWPEYDPELAAEDQVEIAVQVRGKVRDRIVVPVDITEDAAIKLALASEAVQHALGGAAPQRVIYVPGRLVNIVV